MSDFQNHPLVVALIAALEEAADPVIAEQMQAYMKTDAPFYGVKAPIRQAQLKKIAADFKTLKPEEYEGIVLALWHHSHREVQYQGLDIAERYKKCRTLDAWPLYKKLMQECTWWDTLDFVAGRLMSPLLLKHRELEAEVAAWAADENFWVRRASLLAHLKHRGDMNIALLEETILKLAHEEEFFIRKAIGWILREYSKYNAEWVRSFVTKHEQELSGLSKREALKRIGN